MYNECRGKSWESRSFIEAEAPSFWRNMTSLVAPDAVISKTFGVPGAGGFDDVSYHVFWDFGTILQTSDMSRSYKDTIAISTTITMVKILSERTTTYTSSSRARYGTFMIENWSWFIGGEMGNSHLCTCIRLINHFRVAMAEETWIYRSIYDIFQNVFHCISQHYDGASGWNYHHGIQGPTYHARSSPWLSMSWWNQKSGHRQPSHWCWLSKQSDFQHEEGFTPG